MYGGSVPGAPPAPSVWDKAKDAGKAIQKGYRDFEQRNRAADPTPMKPSDMYGSQPRASSAPALSEPAGDGAGAFAPAAPAQAPAQAPANTFRPTKRRTDGRSSDARQPVDPRYPSRAVPMQVASYLPGGPSLANTAVRPLDMLQALRTSGFG